MTRLLYLAPIFLALSVAPYHVPPPSYQHARDALSCYELASLVTGCPEAILRGIARAESGERDSAVGDGGESIGRFQLREIYHEARARAWGEYDPRKADEAAIIAGHIVMDNLARLGDIDLAIAAYRQGVGGVLRDGMTEWYVRRVYGK